MKVTLQQFVKGLGAPGAVVEVSPGYARNFLFPRNLAVNGTQVLIKATTSTAAGSAFPSLDRLSQQGIVLQAPANGQKLYGAIGEEEIRRQIKLQTGINIEPATFIQFKGLKLLGDQQIKARWQGQDFTIRCIVKAQHAKN